MKKIEDKLYKAFLIFLIIRSAIPFYNSVNNVLSTVLIILSVLTMIKLKLDREKHKKIDFIDIILVLIPILYTVIYITGNNLLMTKYLGNKLLLEYGATLSLLTLRRFINKEQKENILKFLCISAIIIFFSSFLLQFHDTQMAWTGVVGRFGDQYRNSIDRLYGTFDYCNATAYYFVTCFFIALCNLMLNKKHTTFYQITLFICFIGFLITFSKMLTIVFSVILIALVIINLINKRKDCINEIITNLAALSIPAILFVTEIRNILINSNTLKLFQILITFYVLYIIILEKLKNINKKWKYTSMAFLIIFISIFCYLLQNPIYKKLHIKDVEKNNDYILTEFFPRENSNVTIDFTVEGNYQDVKYNIWQLKVEDQYQKYKLISKGKLKEKNKINISTDEDYEYYYIELKNINKKSNLTVGTIKINNEKYYVNTFLVPYQYTKQLDLSKYDVESVTSRFRYYKYSMDILSERKSILGGGYKTYSYYLLNGRIDDIEANPHSTFFNLWLEVGIYGAIYYILLAIIGIIYMLKNYKSSSKVVWFCIFCVSMMIFPFDYVMDEIMCRLLLMLSFIQIKD